jgi:hypothetical protein
MCSDQNVGLKFSGTCNDQNVGITLAGLCCGQMLFFASVLVKVSHLLACEAVKILVCFTLAGMCSRQNVGNICFHV